MKNYKEKVFSTAISRVKERVRLLTEERKAINTGILEDTKSSAGDKFETGRERMSADLMTVEKQLKQASFDYDELCRLQAIKNSSSTAQEGSLVLVDDDKFLISIGMGQLDLDGEKVFLLSKNSPLGEILVGKRKGEEIDFRGKKKLVKEIV